MVTEEVILNLKHTFTCKIIYIILFEQGIILSWVKI